MIQYYNGNYRAVADIFYSAVHETATSCYSQDQVNAWAPSPVDYEFWQLRCEFKRPFLCVEHNKIVGFLELDTDGHIDCHYVHPEYNRKGCGSELLRHAVATAAGCSLERLYVEASHLAKGLYLKCGFQVTVPNQIIRRGVVIENWLMELLMANKPNQWTTLRPATEL